MDIAYKIEDVACEVSVLKDLFLAIMDAAFNGTYTTEQSEEAFNHLYSMICKQSENLKALEDEAFKLLKAEKENKCQEII